MSGKRMNELEALALMRGGMTRRDVLRRFGAAGGVLAAGSLLAACGGSGGSTGGGGPSSSSGPVSIDKTVAPNWVFSNWPLYIDVKNKTDHPSLDKFDKQFLTMMHKEHEKDIAYLQSHIKGTSGDVRAFLDETLPVLEKHRERIRLIDCADRPNPATTPRRSEIGGPATRIREFRRRNPARCPTIRNSTA